jgi:hypothetical protein
MMRKFLKKSKRDFLINKKIFNERKLIPTQCQRRKKKVEKICKFDIDITSEEG